MSIEEIVSQIYRNESGKEMTLIHFEGRKGTFSDIPFCVPETVSAGLRKIGIEKLYSHQSEAIEGVLSGKNVVVATPTASGKTLCYNVPVLSAISKDPAARAIYLFPTKALSFDQQTGLSELLSTGTTASL